MLVTMSKVMLTHSLLLFFKEILDIKRVNTHFTNTLVHLHLQMRLIELATCMPNHVCGKILLIDLMQPACCARLSVLENGFVS